jgi:hypothetical protein
LSELKSLESKIRNLIIKLAMEQDNITLAMDHAHGIEFGNLLDRRIRLGKLANACLVNTDKEIEFFHK